MQTYYTREIESVNGTNYVWLKYFNSEESFSHNSYVFNSDEQMTDEQCISESEKSFEEMNIRIKENNPHG
jgi:hypothetical protein